MSMAGYSVGIDVGGTKVFSQLFDSSLKSISSDKRPSGQGALEVTESISQSLLEVTQSAGIDIADLDGVGIGIPGQVDPLLGEVSNAVNLGFEYLNLGQELFERFGLTSSILNDVNATAMGIAKSHPPTDTLAYLNFGTGLAAGFVIDGKLLLGSNNLAGEIGHFSADPNGSLCPCGQRGCLETLASASGIKSYLLEKGATPQDWLSFEKLPHKLRENIGNRFIEGMTKAVTAISLSLNPDYIYLGGGTLDVIREDRGELLSLLLESELFPNFLAKSDFLERVRFVENHSSLATLGSVVSLGAKT
jgi:predicted NBD/HSP70 family sugar kinase